MSDVEKDLAKFDSDLTARYKIAHKNKIPVDYTYKDEKGEILSIFDYIKNNINNSLLNIYKYISEKTNKLGALYIIYVYSEIYENKNGNNEKYDVDTLLNIINEFIEELNIYLPTLEIRVFDNYERFVEKYDTWSQNYEIQLKRDMLEYNRIINVQKILLESTPVKMESPEIHNIKIEFSPKFKNDDKDITINDGIDIFNQSIPTKYIPFIQYNDGSEKSFFRILKA